MKSTEPSDCIKAWAYTVLFGISLSMCDPRNHCLLQTLPVRPVSIGALQQVRRQLGSRAALLALNARTRQMHVVRLA